MNAMVNFRKCTLANEELLTKVDNKTDFMYSEFGKVPSRNIPAKVDDDYDLLIGELLVRFRDLEHQNKEYIAIIQNYSMRMETLYKKIEEIELKTPKK